MASNHHHFLIVTSVLQGQINPSRHLARRLARTASVRVTLAIPASGYRRMFPDQQLEVMDEGQLVSYAAYSDGFDEVFHPDKVDGAHFMSRFELVGSESLTRLVRSLADRGRPVTCLVYTLLLPWAADVARDILGIPAILYWIQPAAVFSIYYHYFHGYADVISAHKNDPSFSFNLPGLPQLQIKDLPSVLTDSYNPYFDSFEGIMRALEKDERRRVLINTFHALEADAIEAIGELNLISVGPIIENADAFAGKDLFEQDKSGYLEWLETKEEKSVVYISFGSISKFNRDQMNEISKGLKDSGRPYLWVVRRDSRGLVDDELAELGDGDGMVVVWCDQVRVLSHSSVGCFVTHCGWNSTMESIVNGVPMVMVPQWVDQMTNAKMAEGVWGTGVRAEVNGEGVMEGTELKRCLNVVMGEDGLGAEIRKKAETWKVKASVAVGDDGPSVKSLLAFVNEM